MRAFYIKDKIIQTTNSKYAWVMWTIANLMVIFASSSQVSYAYINRSLSDELNLSITQIALIGSFYTWVFALTQFFSGSILTILGIRKVFLALTSFILVGFFIFINSTSFYGILLAQFFIALGASCSFVGAGYAGGVWFGFSKYGAMFALTQAFASSGAFLSGSLYAHLVKSGLIWSEILSFIACYGVFVLVLITLFVKDPKSDKLVEKIDFAFFKGVFEMLFYVLRQRAVLVSAISGGISFGVFLSMAALWCPKILISMGFDEAIAGTLTSLNWIGLAVGCVCITKLSNYFKNRRIVFSVLVLIQALSIFALLYTDSKNIYLMGFLVFFSSFFASSQMLTFTIAAESIDEKYMGASASMVNGFMFIFTGLIMAFSGKFLYGNRLEDYQSALCFLPVLLVVSAVVIFATKESFKGEASS